MTPEWLYKHSTITKPFTVYSKYLKIPAGKVSHERLIQAELIAPDILTATDSVAVKLTIAMDTVLADSNDHDPIFGISDGTNFFGFAVFDKGNLHNIPPCYSFEGINNDGTLKNWIRDSTGTKVTSQRYSSEITIQIKQNDQWGSCHTEHDEGQVKIGNYQRKLDFTNFTCFSINPYSYVAVMYILLVVQIQLS